MYAKLEKYIKDHLESTVNIKDIQVGYYGDMSSIDFRKPAILIEKRKDSNSPRSTAWNDSVLQFRVWIMNEIYRDYLESQEELDDIIGGDSTDQVCLKVSLDQLAEDDSFRQMSGTMAGKEWRVKSNHPLEYTDIDFSINQRGSSRINTAQMSLFINAEQRRT